MNFNNYKNENKINGRHIILFFAALQSLVFLFGLIIGVNPTSMVIFASTSLGSTIILYTLYNKKKSKDHHFIEFLQEP
jgi:heme O synthase-like polyprenyltransferase